jgi:hypothetical protein
MARRPGAGVDFPFRRVNVRFTFGRGGFRTAC